MGTIQQKPIKIKGVADIVFCIDATGSMGPCIDAVKNNVGAFVDSIKASSPNNPIDWRSRILGYRDFNVDTEYIINDMDFVSTPEELKTQLSRITAKDGGDEPESTLDAILYAVLKSNWRTPCTKIVVVFTDAPPLQNLNAKTTEELGVPDDMNVIQQKIIENRIKLFIFGAKHPVYDELNKIAVKVIQMEQAGDGLKTLDFSEVLKTLGKTVSEATLSGGEVI